MHEISLDYFHALEDDLEHYSRYVEPHQDNFNTYGLELVRLLLAAGSEIDVALKELCKEISPLGKPGNINDYRDIILQSLPHFTQNRVVIKRFDLDLMPWENWETTSPVWWKAYNSVKHNRLANYKLGSLENTFLAVAALGTIMTYLGNSEKENFRGNFMSRLYLRTSH